MPDKKRDLWYLGPFILGYLGLALPLFSSESPIRISAPSSRSGFVSMLVTLTENTLWVFRRSSRHQGLMSLLVCEQEPCSHLLSWLLSMALYADPNWYKDDCAAFPWRAKFSPAETTDVFKGRCFSAVLFWGHVGGCHLSGRGSRRPPPHRGWGCATFLARTEWRSDPPRVWSRWACTIIQHRGWNSLWRSEKHSKEISKSLAKLH